MSNLAIAIAASPFLSRRIAGLSGIARSVILADLEGATTIYIVAPEPVDADWRRSFEARERALPHVIFVDRFEKIPQARRVLALPDDRLVTRAGMKAAIAGGDASVFRHPDNVILAQNPRLLASRILAETLKPGDGWVARRIDRPISLKLAAFLTRWDISPNSITWFTLLVAIVMTATLAIGGGPALVIGGALYQVVMVLDCVDGDVARVTYRTSRFGATLDTACDMIANLGFVSGLTLGLTRTYGNRELAIMEAMFGVALACMIVMTLLLRLGPRHGSFDVLRAAISVRLGSRPRLLALVLTCEKMFKRDVYVLLAAVLCASGFASIVPPLGLAGVTIWLLAIVWCAPIIAADKSGRLLPSHLRL